MSQTDVSTDNNTVSVIAAATSIAAAAAGMAAVVGITSLVQQAEVLSD